MNTVCPYSTGCSCPRATHLGSTRAANKVIATSPRVCDQSNIATAIRSRNDNAIGAWLATIVCPALLDGKFIVWSRGPTEREALIIIVLFRVFTTAGLVAVGNIVAGGICGGCDLTLGVLVTPAGLATTLALKDRVGVNEADSEGQDENTLHLD